MYQNVEISECNVKVARVLLNISIFVTFSASHIAEHFHSMLMLNLEKHYKALGKDKPSYYRNVLYTGYIH